MKHTDPNGIYFYHSFQSVALESASSCSAHTSEIYVLALFTPFALTSVDVHFYDIHIQSYSSSNEWAIFDLLNELLKEHTVLLIFLLWFGNMRIKVRLIIIISVIHEMCILLALIYLCIWTHNLNVCTSHDVWLYIFQKHLSKTSLNASNTKHQNPYLNTLYFTIILSLWDRSINYYIFSNKQAH